jgi:hypothetical protein
MQVGYVEILAGTGGIINTDIWATIDEQLHEHTPDLGTDLTQLVQQKTPVLTGALEMSMTFEAYLDPQGSGGGPGDLVFIYADDADQLAVWARVYVQYQEGDPLGVPTYTNPPREMFYQTATTDGLPIVETWAAYWIQWALDMAAGGAGVPI